MQYKSSDTWMINMESMHDDYILTNQSQMIGWCLVKRLRVFVENGAWCAGCTFPVWPDMVANWHHHILTLLRMKVVQLYALFLENMLV